MAHLTINFRSKALGMPVMLDVLMPQGRGGYKTLYLLHGAGGDHTSWVLNTRIADYVNNRNIAVVMHLVRIDFMLIMSMERTFIHT